ncbi:GNAT family N-acetyltransferase [Winogradskya humida]|uniref:GNAT family N-acetyltransferase n=1 Tax=Winogradskya humida TaxID=113566 RepID=UPI0031DCE4A3
MTTLTLGRDDFALQQRLSDELDALNNAALTSDDEAALSVRLTADDGTLLGGLTGWTRGGCGGITSLWIAPQARGTGLGSRLILAAEAEIVRRGCDRVVVATMSFQAPGFYLRHGYREVGLTPDMPDGTAKHHFHKHLTPPALPRE